MKQNHANSDLRNPLGWFENVIINDLMYHYRDDFYTEAQRLYKDKSLLIDYNDNSITYDLAVSDDGYAHRFRYTYADYFDRIVEIEKGNSIALISSRLNDCKTREEKAITTENILNKLYYLIDLLKKKRKLPIRGFPILPSSLCEIVISFGNIAHYSLPNPLPGIFEEALNPQLHLFSNLVEESDSNLVPHTSTDTIKKPNQTSRTSAEGNQSAIDVHSFEWCVYPSLYTMGLHNILISEGIITEKETPLEIFEKAFNGKIIKEPLKIKWHLKNNRGSYKAPIIRMLMYLMDEAQLLKKIEVKNDFARMIEEIFVDSTGNFLKATEITMQNLGESPSIEEKRMIDNLSTMKVKQE
jgi:hypothetical protein